MVIKPSWELGQGSLNVHSGVSIWRLSGSASGSAHLLQGSLTQSMFEEEGSLLDEDFAATGQLRGNILLVPKGEAV